MPRAPESIDGMDKRQQLVEHIAHLEETLREVQQEHADGVERSSTGYGELAIYSYEDHIVGLQEKIVQS